MIQTRQGSNLGKLTLIRVNSKKDTHERTMHRSLSSATAHSECSAAATIARLRDQAIPLRDDGDTQMHDDVDVEPEWDLSAQASPKSKYQVDQRAVLDEIVLDPQGELGDFSGGLVSLNRWQGGL